jgi:hypothetical protein
VSGGDESRSSRRTERRPAVSGIVGRSDDARHPVDRAVGSDTADPRVITDQHGTVGEHGHADRVRDAGGDRRAAVAAVVVVLVAREGRRPAARDVPHLMPVGRHDEDTGPVRREPGRE